MTPLHLYDTKAFCFKIKVKIFNYLQDAACSEHILSSLVLFHGILPRTFCDLATLTYLSSSKHHSHLEELKLIEIIYVKYFTYIATLHGIQQAFSKCTIIQIFCLETYKGRNKNNSKTKVKSHLQKFDHCQCQWELIFLKVIWEG